MPKTPSWRRCSSCPCTTCSVRAQPPPPVPALILIHFSIHMWGLLYCCITWALSMMPFFVCFFKWASFCLFVYLCMFDCNGSHCCAWAFSSCGKWELFSSCGVRASHCSDFSCHRAWTLGYTGWVAPWHVESSQTRDGTHVLCIGRWILNHQTTRKVQWCLLMHYSQQTRACGISLSHMFYPSFYLFFHVSDLNAWVNSLSR